MRFAAMLICAFLLAGCVDHTAVRDISTQLTKATSSWGDVGAEIKASCQREAMLNPALLNCDSEELAAQGVISANSVLSDYFKALVDASSDANFTLQPGLDAATKSVANIPNVKKEQVNAVSGLVGLLTQLSLNTMRENTLLQLIDDGVPYAKTIINGLSDALGEPLLTRLDAEKIQLTSVYLKKIRDQRDVIDSDLASLCHNARAAGFSGTGYLLTQDYCHRLAIIETREKAVATYQSSLEDASKALTKLSSAKLSDKDLAEQLNKIGADLDSKIDSIKKAFNSGGK